jgi:hypothetical protein
MANKTARKAFTKGQIAQYWIDWQIEHRRVPPWDRWGWDWGEPSCMACGYWQQSWDKGRTIKSRWERSDLQKCHVVPLYLGGADELSNLVLMCKRCHDPQPNDRDPEVTYAYMRARNLWDGMGIGGALTSGLLAMSGGASVEEATALAVADAKTLLGVSGGP